MVIDSMQTQKIFKCCWQAGGEDQTYVYLVYNKCLQESGKPPELQHPNILQDPPAEKELRSYQIEQSLSLTGSGPYSEWKSAHKTRDPNPRSPRVHKPSPAPPKADKPSHKPDHSQAQYQKPQYSRYLYDSMSPPPNLQDTHYKSNSSSNKNPQHTDSKELWYDRNVHFSKPLGGTMVKSNYIPRDSRAIDLGDVPIITEKFVRGRANSKKNTSNLAKGDDGRLIGSLLPPDAYQP